MKKRVETKCAFRDNVISQLEAMSTANHCGAGTLLVRDGIHTLRCRIRSTDRLACEVDSIHVTSPRFEQMTEDALDSIVGDLVERLSYLEERLVVVENDLAAKESQVRSTAPIVVSDGARSYYELIIGPRGIQLHRYEKLLERTRQTVSHVFTRAVLIRIGQDLLDLASGESSR